MKIVFFSHPDFLGHQSMPRFTRMLSEGMKQRGHDVEVWSPQPRFYRLSVAASMVKWLGYVDQYIVFPFEVRRRLKRCAQNTLFVLTDQALGPWMTLIATRHHVVHCHDFLALKSAKGEIPENKTRWTGRKYQSYIQRGFSKGKNFISVSKRTKEHLTLFLPSLPFRSEVVYNGVNHLFKPFDTRIARNLLGNKLTIDLTNGFLLHVGGNQWYKNRTGVIAIYNAWRTINDYCMPLLLIGASPSNELQELYSRSPFKADIHFLSDIDDQLIRMAYVGASIFLFPSLAEGFGWPIVEAMASGCPVITTDEDPMTEVAGNAAFLISRCPDNNTKVGEWAVESAKIVNKVLLLDPVKRSSIIEAGLRNAKRFDAEQALDEIEKIYKEIIQE